MYNRIKRPRMQGKTADHRDLIIRSLVMELVRNEKLKTTPNKARILKSQFDKLVTKAKKNTDHSKRLVQSFFGDNKLAVTKFYTLVDKNFNDRNSGYTYSARTLPRKGDNAEQMYVMIVNRVEKVKKTNIQKALEKREKAEKEKSVASRVRKAVGVNKVNKVAKAPIPVKKTIVKRGSNI